jgi:hypothetical protein
MRRIRRGELTQDELLEQQIEEARQRRFLKAMALKTAIGLSDEERHSLAQMIPGVDKDQGGSWKDLNPRQLSILINMLEGYVLIAALINQRPVQVYTAAPGGFQASSGSHTHSITINQPAHPIWSSTV